jgi:hypothetical protein
MKIIKYKLALLLIMLVGCEVDYYDSPNLLHPRLLQLFLIMLFTVLL